MNTIRTTVVLATLVALAQPASGEIELPEVRSDDSIARTVDDWLGSLHDAGLFNGSVLLSREGEILFSGNYGYSGPAQKVALTNRSSFNMASVTKQFTAFSILKLVHEGKLSLDDPVGKHISEWGYDGVTIRHMLNHTSGLPDYLAIAETEWDPKTLLTNEVMVSLLRDHAPSLDFPPGDRYEYSNTAYVALAVIVERISGLSFSEYLNVNIFDPLGMDHTATFNLLTDESVLKHRVLGFDGHMLNDLTNLDAVLGDGGMYSTATDLMKWDRALYGSELLPQAVIRHAFASGDLNDGSPIGYGYGWFVRGNDVVDHTGWWIGFDSYIRRDMKNESLLIIMANGSHHENIYDIYDELARVIDAWTARTSE